MISKVVAQLDVLTPTSGHDKETITIKDDNPDRRAQLAEKITALVKDGFTVLLSDGSKVRGYDPNTNEWLVATGRKQKDEQRVPAKDHTATAVAPTAGG